MRKLFALLKVSRPPGKSDEWQHTLMRATELIEALKDHPFDPGCKP